MIIIVKQLLNGAIGFGGKQQMTHFPIKTMITKGLFDVLENVFRIVMPVNPVVEVRMN